MSANAAGASAGVYARAAHDGPCTMDDFRIMKGTGWMRHVRKTVVATGIVALRRFRTSICFARFCLYLCFAVDECFAPLARDSFILVFWSLTTWSSSSSTFFTGTIRT